MFVLLSMVLQGLTGTNGSAVTAQDWTDTVQPSLMGASVKPQALAVLAVSVFILGALRAPLIVSLLKCL